MRGQHCQVTCLADGATCCAQLHSLLPPIHSGKVTAKWCLAMAQVGLGRLDEAEGTLREAVTDHALMCRDTAMALVGVLGADGERTAQTAGSGRGVSGPADDSTCGA